MPYKLEERTCPSCNKKKRYTIAQVTCPGCPGVAAKKTVVHTTPEEREVHLRKEVQRLTADVSELMDLRGSILEAGERVAAAIIASPAPVLGWTPKPKHPKNVYSAVLMLSDWHIGEIINSRETAGYNEYNWAIAQKRVAAIVAGFRSWVETHRANFTVQELVVLLLGDFVSGDIHRELSITNEFPVPVQIAKVGLLLGRVVSELSRDFPKVRLVEIGGDNHGRYQPKPQFKQKTLNNATYLVYTIANQFLAEHENVEVFLSDGFQERIEIAGKQFLCEHGDNIKAYMGIPYYGMARHKGREAQRRMTDHSYYDYIAIGHWHIPSIIEGNILVNGSLCGTTEYDHAASRYSPPAQVSFLVHPVWGIFDWVPWRAK